MLVHFGDARRHERNECTHQEYRLTTTDQGLVTKVRYLSLLCKYDFLGANVQPIIFAKLAVITATGASDTTGIVVLAGETAAGASTTVGTVVLAGVTAPGASATVWAPAEGL